MSDNRPFWGRLGTFAGVFVGALVGLLIESPHWVQYVLAGFALLSVCAMTMSAIQIVSTSPWIEKRRESQLKAAQRAAAKEFKLKSEETKRLRLEEFEAEFLPWDLFCGEAMWILRELYELRDKQFNPTQEVSEEWARRIGLARNFASGIDSRLRDAAHKHIAAVEDALTKDADSRDRQRAEDRLHDWVEAVRRRYGPWAVAVGWQRH